MLDEYWSRIPEAEAQKAEIALGISRKRSRIQGSIAATVRVEAELKKASELAKSDADEAIALLRFLSPMNWTCKRVSHCLPVGRENTRGAVELLVENGEIKKQIESTVEDGPSGWSIDEARQPYPGLLELLHKLALERGATRFKTDLFRALQLHARNSVAAEVPHKILFVVAAIESLLLRSSGEPIQKNLGERMAFIIGNSLQERKSVVANVDDFYRLRSALFHHGKPVSPANTALVDTFFVNVWFTLYRLVAEADRFKTKDELLETLQERKLT
jgi:hypothetical protein